MEEPEPNRDPFQERNCSTAFELRLLPMNLTFWREALRRFPILLFDTAPTERCPPGSWSPCAISKSWKLPMNPIVVGTSRRDVPARRRPGETSRLPRWTRRRRRSAPSRPGSAAQCSHSIPGVLSWEESGVGRAEASPDSDQFVPAAGHVPEFMERKNLHVLDANRSHEPAFRIGGHCSVNAHSETGPPAVAPHRHRRSGALQGDRFMGRTGAQSIALRFPDCARRGAMLRAPRKLRAAEGKRAAGVSPASPGLLLARCRQHAPVHGDSLRNHDG